MLTRMTINADAAFHEPLTTEHDMIERIRALLAPASHPAQLWVMMLDGAGRQMPVLIPLDERPKLPDPSLVDGLIGALAELIADREHDGARVLFVVERFGPFGPTNDDHCWAAALTGACARAGVGLAGVFLLSPGGVSLLST